MNCMPQNTLYISKKPRPHPYVEGVRQWRHLAQHVQSESGAATDKQNSEDEEKPAERLTAIQAGRQTRMTGSSLSKSLNTTVFLPANSFPSEICQECGRKGGLHTIRNLGQDVGLLKLLYRAGRNIQWYCHVGKQLATAHKVKHILQI